MTGVLLAAKGEAAKAGPIGLVVILLLCIACYFLFKSMSRHMRNVRENFPVDGSAPPDAAPTRPGPDEPRSDGPDDDHVAVRPPTVTPRATRPAHAPPPGE